MADVDLPAPDDTVHCLFGEVFEVNTTTQHERSYPSACASDRRERWTAELRILKNCHGGARDEWRGSGECSIYPCSHRARREIDATTQQAVRHIRSAVHFSATYDAAQGSIKELTVLCLDEGLLSVQGIDILTPIGRGQCILLISENSQELSRLTEHMLAAQASASVSCIYACIGKSVDEQNAFLSRLRESEGVKGTVFVAASDEESIGEQFASLCAALAFGGTYLFEIPHEDIILCFVESIRDAAGGDALVIIDSLRPLVDVWNLMQKFTVDIRRTSYTSFARYIRERIKSMDDVTGMRKERRRRIWRRSMGHSWPLRQQNDEGVWHWHCSEKGTRLSSLSFLQILFLCSATSFQSILVSGRRFLDACTHCQWFSSFWTATASPGTSDQTRGHRKGSKAFGNAQSEAQR